MDGDNINMFKPMIDLRHCDNGKDRSRVDDVMRRPCICGKGCFKKQQLDEVLEFLDAFWSLEKPNQDRFVRPLLSSSEYKFLCC